MNESERKSIVSDIIVELSDNGREYSSIGNVVDTAKFKGKVLTELQYLREQVDDIRACNRDLEERIIGLENFKAIAMFIWAAIGVLAKVGWDYVNRHLIQ